MTSTLSELTSANLWPLTLWIALRAVDPDRPNLVGRFMDFLRVSDNEELFAWDDTDNASLYSLLSRTFTDNHPESSLEFLRGHRLCSLDWDQCMAEIDSETWATIKEMTWTKDRPRRVDDRADELRIRLAAVSIKFSSTMRLPKNLLASLNITIDQDPFDLIARLVDPDYQLAEVHSWAEDRNWFLAQIESLCHVVWNTYSPHASFLKRMMCVYLVVTRVRQSNAVRTSIAPGKTIHLQNEQSREGQYDQYSSTGLARDILGLALLRRLSSLHLDFLEAFKCLRSDLNTLLAVTKHCEQWISTVLDPHEIAVELQDDIRREISKRVKNLALHLEDTRSYKEILALRGTDAQLIIDLLQDVLDVDSFSTVKPHICKALCRLSRASGLHPRCFALTGLQKVGQQIAAGGFGDIWKGLVRGQGVCVKIMRVFQDADIEAILKEFGREALIWRQLCHPNLLPFFGVYYLDNRLCLVSPWMENGNIMEFLRTQPNAHRLSLILDVALGVRYLHRQRVVHGDLKAINVLVTPSRRACIADFGLSAVSNTITMRFTHSTAQARGGTARYQAPELFQGDSPNHYGSDVYAVACVFYEILTGRVPFWELPNDMNVMFRVTEGKRPSRPLPDSGTQISDTFWELLQNCWDKDAELRPTAAQIVKRLTGPLIRATTVSSTTDWDDQFTSKFRRSFHSQPILPSVAEVERMIFGDEVAQACEECRDPDRNEGLYQHDSDREEYVDHDDSDEVESVVLDQDDSDQEEYEPSTKEIPGSQTSEATELERRLKRAYEESPSDSDEEDELSAWPRAKRSKLVT
ncbi:kinase-like domain-containing protein [Mycena polygramma]|nr:kinase-like domain-containing protein [Mycena polygramma]